MRRFVALLFAIFVLATAFSISVSSVEMPDNNVVTNIDLYFGSATHETGMHYSMSTGEVLYAYFDLISGSGLNGPIVISFDFTLSRSATIYLICLSNQTFSSNPFDSYYDSTGNFSYTYTSGSKIFTIDTSTTPHSYSVSDFSGTTNYVMSGYRYIDVPAGSYSLVSSQASYSGRDFAIGLYIVSNQASFDDIISSVGSGSSSLSTGVSDLTNLVNSNVSSAETSCDKFFAIMQGQFYLDQLLIASDDRSMQQLHDSFIPSLDSQISAYQSGDQTLVTTLTNMSSSYSSALSSAETAEQGSMITSAYSFKLQYFRLIAEQMAADRLDSAISDDEMQEMTDYYTAEDNLLAQFDIQQFKDALTFDLWFQQLDLVESNSYKSIFDYIINESPIKLYITIPLALLIVSILLGTRLRSSSHKSGDSS